MMLNFKSTGTTLALFSVLQLATAAEPIRITSCQELQNMGANLDGDYYLDNPIDCAGFNFTTIPGTFTGSLDGQHHKIENLTVTAEPKKRGGIFFGLLEAQLTNLHFVNPTVHAEDQVERGLLAGRMVSSTISNVKIHNLTIPGHSTYTSVEKGSASGFTGGITGYAEWSGFNNIEIHQLELRHHTYTGGIVGVGNIVNLSQCGVYDMKSNLDPNRNYPSTRDKSKSPITRSKDKSDDRRKEYDTAMGGLVGIIPTSQQSSQISLSRSSGDISGPLNIGGLVGLADYQITLDINNSYSLMNVTAENFAGGILGRAGDSYITNRYLTTLDHVYAAGKVDAQHHARGLVGNKDNGGHTSHARGREAYFDKEATGRIHPGMKHVKAVTTEALTYNQANTLRTENGWSQTTWLLFPHKYPLLAWEE